MVAEPQSFFDDDFPEVEIDETLILDTGGTFGAEKYLDWRKPPKYSTMLEESVIPKTIEHIKANLAFASGIKIGKCTKRDSKDYTVAELEKILLKIKKSGAKKVVIIHGTDSIFQNAEAMEHLMRKHDIDCNIVFTGAYIPIDNGLEVSDGTKNLEVALNTARKTHMSITSSQNISVVLEGKVFDTPKDYEKTKQSNGSYKVEQKAKTPNPTIYQADHYNTATTKTLDTEKIPDFKF